ncbi:Uncharacterized protein OBRU01_22681 [Operophtera brumata]|uniref:Uncharacterized protein n=1 Tax=Operophtera brumata TaxID=104452 RepID=A0A0L7KP81_OPEBR|nr:Uncharacterized protein OBRU01_22681 [Operophtera brumata]
MIRQEYFYPQPCLARGLRAGVNALLTNADEGTRSTHLIKIEVYNLQKFHKIAQNEHWKHADFKLYANVLNKIHQKQKKLLKKLHPLKHQLVNLQLDTKLSDALHARKEGKRMVNN